MSGYSGGEPQPQPAGPSRPDHRRGIAASTLLVAFVGLASYGLIASGVDSAGTASASRAAAQAVLRPTAAASARSAPAVSSPASGGPSPAPAEPARALEVAAATAYGPDGVTDGDHPNLVPGIINGGDGQAWHSSWYATPEFGNLQSGTGLLFDMGKTVTVSSVRLVLGSPVGADIQVQVENTVLPAELPVAASASDVGGTVLLRLSTPATGRYVLVWFTRLPPNSNGENQVDVYSATVYGT
jgi:hypothetical protein